MKAAQLQQRANARIDVSMATWIHYQGEKTIGTVINLSPGGAFVRCQDGMAVGKRVEVFVAMGDGQSPANQPFTGTIKHTCNNGIGVKFDTLSPAALLRLITLLT